MKKDTGILGDTSNEVKLQSHVIQIACLPFVRFSEARVDDVLQACSSGRNLQSQLKFRSQKASVGSRKGPLQFSAAGNFTKPDTSNLRKISEQPPPAPKTRGQQREPVRAHASTADGPARSRDKHDTAQHISSPGQQHSKSGRSR